ncbi:MAG: hypothetical protein H6748_16565 [Spirochaetaceae bacterium]|nr:hypothetical protein [Myxococcales bacterium]MCB9725662.1 hypothetical protein [Spirochaetaceae bacterium]HPG24239.1 hypothetical protein [Myxococcota bacterium]
MRIDARGAWASRDGRSDPERPGGLRSPSVLASALVAACVAFACATPADEPEPSPSRAALVASAETRPIAFAEDPAQARTDDPYLALERLADRLKETAAIAREAQPSRAPFGRGEGALHVLRLLRRAVDEELAWADTRHPWLQVQDERFAKLALGNPDNLYLVARCEDDAIYRLRGRLGTTADFNVQVYQGYPGVHRPFAAHGALGLDELEVDEDGRFEILIGGAPRERNWIELRPDSRRILVRYTYGDWTSERAGELGLERVGSRGEAATPVSDETVAMRIDAAAGYLLDAFTGYLAVTEELYGALPENSLRPMRRLGGESGGLRGQYNATGRYRLGDDEALVVTTRPSDARYQGFQLGTDWFEALDFANQVTSLNTRQARLDPDGVYRFVIATRDPGFANWLDASAAPQGQMLLRWQGVGPLSAEHEPRVELVAFDDLPNHFPAGAVRVDVEARRRQIAERQAAIEHRYGLGAR